LSIEACNVTKRFGGFVALREVDLRVEAGELVALLGPSGSGKTTLLRIIAGLEFPDQGTMLFNGEDTTRWSVGERRVGFVFQHHALFKHLRVFDNVAFGPRMRPRKSRPSESEIRAKVQELLRLVQLDGLEGRYPSQLSGGQRQRIALARALAVEPRVLLLDEPFGALDARVRQELRRWLRALHDRLGITSLFVTHDQQEALEVADRVVIMNQGRIEQIGTPEQVYDEPANPFVYRFLGDVNRLPGRADRGRIRIGDSAFEALEQGAAPDGPVVGYVRPHDLEISRDRTGSAALEATVQQIAVVGPTVRLALKAFALDQQVEAELSKDAYRQLALEVGDTVLVRPRRLRVFAEV
jgi:sulfate transport system ATP-binding protein